MKDRNTLFGLLAAILIGALVAVGVQAFSEGIQQGTQVAEESDTANIVEPTIVPDTSDATVEPLDVEVGGEELPTMAPAEETKPTAQPLATAPAGISLSAEDNVLFADDFSSDTINDWTFAQIEDHPLPPEEWEIRDDDYASEVLFAQPNEGVRPMFDDTIALPPVTLSDGGAIEVSATSTYAEKMGLVVGYEDDQNYLAMIFGTEDARGMFAEPGLSLVRVEAGDPTVLAFDKDLRMTHKQWYTMRLELDGNTLSASIDGEAPLTYTLSDSPSGQQVGLYAGSLGFVYFDNVRVVGK
jgi:hypothetical protein